MARRVAIKLGQKSSVNGTRGRGKLSKVSSQSPPVLNNSYQKLPEKSLQNDNQTYTSDLANKTIDEKVLDTSIKKVKQLENDKLISETSETIRGRKRTLSEFQNDNTQTSPIDMKDIMGFDNFDTTKNKHVKGTDCYGIKFKEKVEYRQYMNREGGFNRELSPTRIEKKKIKMSLKSNTSTKKPKV